MRCLAVLTCATSLATACGPGGATIDGCKLPVLPGALVITEVFADVKATSAGSASGTGADAGKEWFEIYNASAAPIDLAGVTITHSRPDGTKPNTHVVGAAMIAPGQFFTLGNATQALLPAYLDYGYGTDLGALFNTEGGRLALSCGDREIDRASYADVLEGHARELTSAQLPEYLLNDDQANWCEATASEFAPGNFGTPGSANDCQPVAVGRCHEGGTLRPVVTPGPGDLVITEVMPSPSKVSDPTGEWFEAKVLRDVDLNGIGLDRAGDAARPDLISSTDCVHARAGSAIVFARSTDPVLNGGLPAAAILGTFKFSIIAGSAAAPGDVAIVAGDTVVDAVRWTRSTTGRSLQLDPAHIDPASNDAESNFCDATTGYGLGDLGTPGGDNTACAALPMRGLCDEGGAPRPIVGPAAGRLVISEIMADPAVVTDANGEWFEITNTGDAAFDLNELSIGKADDAGTRVQSARCLTVAPHGVALFARSAEPAINGMLPPVAVTFSFSLLQTGGSIQIADGTNVLDVVRWTASKPGVSQQLDPAHLTVTDNDLATSFCDGTRSYGPDNRGTPGTANPPCP
jgi:Lamin Tail Domain